MNATTHGAGYSISTDDDQYVIHMLDTSLFGPSDGMGWMAHPMDDERMGAPLDTASEAAAFARMARRAARYDGLSAIVDGIGGSSIGRLESASLSATEAEAFRTGSDDGPAAWNDAAQDWSTEHVDTVLASVPRASANGWKGTERLARRAYRAHHRGTDRVTIAETTGRLFVCAPREVRPTVSGRTVAYWLAPNAAPMRALRTLAAGTIVPAPAAALLLTIGHRWTLAYGRLLADNGKTIRPSTRAITATHLVGYSDERTNMADVGTERIGQRRAVLSVDTLAAIDALRATCTERRGNSTARSRKTRAGRSAEQLAMVRAKDAERKRAARELERITAERGSLVPQLPASVDA